MRAFFVAITFALAACTPAADTAPQAEAPAGRLEIRDAWAAPTPGGVTVSAGYLTIMNGASEADRLISVASPRAGRVEVHEMVMSGDVMQMRPAASLEIAAGAEINLAPGGLHLMFYEITAPFAEGEDVPVTLTFERAGAVDVSLPVRRPAAESSHGAH
jgi:periplasmic copper chaperone A